MPICCESHKVTRGELYGVRRIRVFSESIQRAHHVLNQRRVFFLAKIQRGGEREVGKSVFHPRGADEQQELNGPCGPRWIVRIAVGCKRRGARAFFERSKLKPRRRHDFFASSFVD